MTDGDENVAKKGVELPSSRFLQLSLRTRDRQRVRESAISVDHWNILHVRRTRTMLAIGGDLETPYLPSSSTDFAAKDCYASSKSFNRIVELTRDLRCVIWRKSLLPVLCPYADAQMRRAVVCLILRFNGLKKNISYKPDGLVSHGPLATSSQFSVCLCEPRQRATSLSRARVLS